MQIQPNLNISAQFATRQTGSFKESNVEPRAASPRDATIDSKPGSIPSNPFRIAQAYGVRPASQVSAPSQASATAFSVGVSSVEGSGRRPTPAQRLVAAVVPGKVDFSGDVPRPGASIGASLPLYRHPADKNAAATGVLLGRSLDVSG